jgi:hypothetical protein
MPKVKRSSRVLRAASIWAPLLLSSGHALADDTPTRKTQAGKVEANFAQPGDAAEATVSKSHPEQAAEAAYQKALVSYSQGDVVAALDSMRQSYELSKRAELLYNLAQLEDELKACTDSLQDYRRYLELVPHGRYREAAKRACERLEHECPLPTTAPTPSALVEPKPENTASVPEPKPSDTAPTPPSYWTAPRVIGWSAIGAGALAGVGALYFRLEAGQAKNEFQQSVDNEANGGPMHDTSLQDRQHRNNNLAIAFAVTGGALIAGGALVLLLDPGKHAPATRSARLYATPGLLGACYMQSF